MIEEQRCPIRGARRNYARVESDGPPLLFLHGVTRRWQCFQPLIPALSHSYDLYALDFRGHGRSDRVADGYRVIDYVSDAVAFIREIIGRPTIVYGHSLGSMVAAAVAGEIPEYVSAVVLEDPPFDTMGARITQTALHGYFSAMQQWASSPLPVADIAAGLANVRMQTPGSDTSVRVGDVRDAASLRFHAKCLTQLDPAALEPIVAARWLDGYDIPGILSRIACPALLLQAELSVGGMLTDEDAADAERRISGCTRVKLDCHHLMHWFETQSVLRALENFLASH